MPVQVHHRPRREGAELMTALQPLVERGLRHEVAVDSSPVPQSR